MDHFVQTAVDGLHFDALGFDHFLRDQVAPGHLFHKVCGLFHMLVVTGRLSTTHLT